MDMEPTTGQFRDSVFHPPNQLIPLDASSLQHDILGQGTPIPIPADISSDPSSDDEHGDLPSSPTTKPPTAAEHQQYLNDAFGRWSPFPNDGLAKLLRLVIESDFLLQHRLEPTISSADGQALLGEIATIHDAPTAPEDSPNSIYTMFVDIPLRKCRICGKSEKWGTMERMLRCVRTHLDHRPFLCTGKGCKSCPQNNIFKSFCTQDALNNHIRKQRTTKCLQCGAIIRINYMQQHLKVKHKLPFPYGERKRSDKEKPPRE